IYVVEADDDQEADGDRTDRDKRKIGVLKLGVSNGIINFVFGKLDSFIDSKTKALSALDEANKVKNAAYGIDTKYSATSKFINELVAAKIKAASGSIGPVLNSAQTFLSSAKQGLAGAVVSKLAPLSSIAQGLSSASSSNSESHDHDHDHSYGGGELSLIAFTCELITTTTEDIPIFDRTRVSLDIPAPLFGSGFTLITNVTKVLNRAILVSEKCKNS
ncbi:LOW QUALITY PROTEIN: hypothetical protein E2986_12559, partial [Frieseomelitta varia]